MFFSSKILIHQKAIIHRMLIAGITYITTVIALANGPFRQSILRRALGKPRGQLNKKEPP